MTGFYSDFLEAAAYRDANGGLGLPYLSPGDIALATQWNLNGDKRDDPAERDRHGHCRAIARASSCRKTSRSAASSAMRRWPATARSTATALDERCARGGTFTGVTEINAGTVANPIMIGTPNIGFVMQLGADNGDTVTLSNTANTYTGGTSILAGTLIIASDGSLGAAPGSYAIDPQMSRAASRSTTASSLTASAKATGR